jgi:ribosomal protein L11 methyltransferase
VRTTRANAKLNHLTGVRVLRLDVLKWTPQRTWPVVAANLYSTILVQIAAKLRRALAPGGVLVFSGVLRAQEEEVARALCHAGLTVSRTTRRGKWIAGCAH